MRYALLLAILASACGRLRFDDIGPRGNDAADAAIDAGAQPDTGTFAAVALPGGGRFDAIALAPDGTRYVLATEQGASRSDDGVSWSPCARRRGNAVAVDAGGVVYLAGDDDVYASTDRCASWVATGLDVHTYALLASPEGLYAGTGQGLRIRAAASWAVVPTPAEGSAVRAIARNPQGNLLAGTAAGVLHASQPGAWTATTTGLPAVLVTYVALGLAQGGVTPAYASSYVLAQLYCSSDGGATWASCFNLASTALLPSSTVRDGLIAGVYDDLVQTTDRMMSVAGDLRTPIMRAAWVSGLARTPSNALVAATYAGVFEAPAGGFAWEDRDQGLDAWDIRRITVDGGDVFIAANMGAMRSLGGAPFEVITAGMTQNSDTSALYRAGTTLFSGGRHLRISGNDGTSWTEVLDAVSDGFRIVAFASDGATVYAGTARRVLRSVPPYTSWTPTLVGGIARMVGDVRVRGSDVWAATDGGVFVSTDGAGSFQPVPAVPAVTASRLAVLENGRIAAATDDGLWISDPAATAWSRAGFAGKVVGDVVARAQTIAAIVDGTVELSGDGGATWAELGGLAGLAPQAAAFDADGGLLVGTSQSGLWRSPVP